MERGKTMKEPEVEVVDEHGNVLNKKKSFNKHLIMTTVIYLIIGLALLLAPGAALVSICYVTGSICLAYSVYLFVIYFRQKERNYYDPGFLFPIVMLGVGLFVIFGAGLIIQILPMIFGILLFISGLMKFRSSFLIRAVTGILPVTGFIMAIVSIVLGIIMFTHPWGTALTFVRIEGIFFIADAVFNIISIARGNKN